MRLIRSRRTAPKAGSNWRVSALRITRWVDGLQRSKQAQCQGAGDELPEQGRLVLYGLPCLHGRRHREAAPADVFDVTQRHRTERDLPRSRGRLGIVDVGTGSGRADADSEPADAGVPHRVLARLGPEPCDAGIGHRLVVRAHHPALAEHEPFERDRLRRRERHVEPRAVLVRAVAPAPEPNVGVRDVAREHLLEAPRAHVPAKPERRRPAPVPEARPPVLGVVLRVVPVALEVVHRRVRGAERGDACDHRCALTSSGPVPPPARPASDDWRDAASSKRGAPRDAPLLRRHPAHAPTSLPPGAALRTPASPAGPRAPRAPFGRPDSIRHPPVRRSRRCPSPRAQRCRARIPPARACHARLRLPARRSQPGARGVRQCNAGNEPLDEFRALEYGVSQQRDRDRIPGAPGIRASAELRNNSSAAENLHIGRLRWHPSKDPPNRTSAGARNPESSDGRASRGCTGRAGHRSARGAEQPREHQGGTR